MGCAGLMDREDTKPVTKYKSPRGMKANDRGKETWLYFLQWEGFQTETTILVFLQHYVNVLVWDSKPSVRANLLPHLVSFFLPIILSPVWFVICPGQATGSHPSSPSYPTPLPITVILQQISMQNSHLLLSKTGSRTPSLQQFLRTKFYGLKHKHSQVPCQYSHCSLHYS